MSPARAVFTGFVTGGVSAVGVLVAIVALQAIAPINYYGSNSSSFDTALVILLLGLLPALIIGGLFGLVTVLPYAYLRDRLALGLAGDIAALVICSAIWSLIQDAAGPLRIWPANFIVILVGAAVGLAPLRVLARTRVAAYSPVPTIR